MLAFTKLYAASSQTKLCVWYLCIDINKKIKKIWKANVGGQEELMQKMLT